MYFETPTDTVYFHTSENTPRGLPDELEKQITEFNGADEVVRMGRCIRGILHLLSGELDDEEIQRHIKENEQIPNEVKDCMSRIIRWRNNIEHKFGYSISEDQLRALRWDYIMVKKWAQSKPRLSLPDECTEI